MEITGIWFVNSFRWNYFLLKKSLYTVCCCLCFNIIFQYSAHQTKLHVSSQHYGGSRNLIGRYPIVSWTDTLNAFTGFTLQLHSCASHWSATVIGQLVPCLISPSCTCLFYLKCTTTITVSSDLTRHTVVLLLYWCNSWVSRVRLKELRTEPALAWADLCNRWSVEMEYSITRRNQRAMWLPPFLLCCVVNSNPLLCIYILCILRFLCFLQIINFDGMCEYWGIQLQHSRDQWVCACVSGKVSGTSVWQFFF